jgi:hypothetical protein
MEIDGIAANPMGPAFAGTSGRRNGNELGELPSRLASRSASLLVFAKVATESVRA